jgi:hypothetical protein
MNETEVEISWTLFFDTQNSQCVNKLRIMVWVLHKDFEGYIEGGHLHIG